MVEAYTVEFLPEAHANLKRFSQPNAQRILNKINWLANNFDSLSREALTGEFKGLFKLRVGDYRVIYSVNNKQRVIIIHLIAHRRSIYERS